MLSMSQLIQKEQKEGSKSPKAHRRRVGSVTTSKQVFKKELVE